jgi:flagellar motor switch protein FliN/FliY
MKTDLATILRLDVPLVVVLGERTMRLGDVRDFVPGTIVELAKSAEEDLELRINNRPIGNGRAVKIGENFGVRVTFVGDPGSRIAALGTAEETGAEADQVNPDEVAAALLSQD